MKAIGHERYMFGLENTSRATLHIQLDSRAAHRMQLVESFHTVSLCGIEMKKGTSKVANAKSTQNKTQNGTGELSDITGGGRSPFFFVDSRDKALARVEPRSTRLSSRS